MTAMLYVVADDLTGAAESGIVLRNNGFQAVIAFHEAAAGQSTRIADLVAGSGLATERDDKPLAFVCASELRIMDNDGAARAITQLLADSVSDTATIAVKIDSLLRGPLPGLLAGIRRACPGARIVVAPALPALGRTTRGGLQLLHGVPIAETDAWKLEPLTAPASVADALGVAAGDPEVLIADATQQSDLDDLVRCESEKDGHIVWLGSAALVRAVAAHAAASVGHLPPAATHVNPLAGPALIVIGSGTPEAAAQSDHLTGRGARTFVVDAATLAHSGAAHLLPTATDLLEALAEGDVVVRIGGEPMAGHAESIADRLAQLVLPAARSATLLVLTGGHTARTILAASGATGLVPVAEPYAGVVVSRVLRRADERHTNEHVQHVITKAGSFGDPTTLARAAQAVRNGSPESTSRSHTLSTLPIIAITMGDAAGVGAEIIVKALQDQRVSSFCRPIVIGDLGRLQAAATIAGVPEKFHTVNGPEDATWEPGVIEVIDIGGIPADLPFGELSAIAGEGAYRYVEKATELAVAGSVQAICTAPLNKAALHLAGHKYPGHTELLAELTGTPEVSMMLSTENVKVIHVTTHIGLIDAIARIDEALVYRTVERGHRTLVASGVTHPTIAVCGINPHAGENGLFGHGEEEEKIEPAIAKLRAEGIDAQGPLPADTVFFRAGRGDFDLVVAMYHDQGHGPVKILGLEAGVNITVGLPVIRTSVDHGTAFDIAGTGKADEGSLIEALRQGAQLAPSARSATE